MVVASVPVRVKGDSVGYDAAVRISAEATDGGVGVMATDLGTAAAPARAAGTAAAAARAAARAAAWAPAWTRAWPVVAMETMEKTFVAVPDSRGVDRVAVSEL